MAEKIDAQQIRNFLSSLIERDWIRQSERRIWPRYAFHYTDMRNAVEVLKNGRLYSRQYLVKSGRLPVSSGSRDILASIDDWVKDCVRLYFRPNTPTQYWAEGVRSKDSLSKSRFPDAHCPVPVFFLFDLPGVLSTPHSRFSDRGLGSHNYQILSNASELEQLNWIKIYHNSWIDMSDRSQLDIIACRNAEIIVPQSLDLSALKYIYCRSAPERETLIHLLPSEVFLRYKSRIISSPRSNFFFRQHTYLEKVLLSANNVQLHFSPDTHSEGAFALELEFKSFTGETLRQVQRDGFYVRSQSGGFNWRIPTPTSEYEIRISLDGALIYANSYVERDIPF